MAKLPPAPAKQEQKVFGPSIPPKEVEKVLQDPFVQGMIDGAGMELQPPPPDRTPPAHLTELEKMEYFLENYAMFETASEAARFIAEAQAYDPEAGGAVPETHSPQQDPQDPGLVTGLKGDVPWAV